MSKKKSEQLGMPFGTAVAQLRKKVLFHLLCKYGENTCYRCKLPIENSSKLSMEHKNPWMDVDVKLFWDIDNISFSHMSCNTAAARPAKLGPTQHGTRSAYQNRGCKCRACRGANRDAMRKLRQRRKLETLSSMK